MILNIHPVIKSKNTHPLWIRGRDIALTLVMWAAYIYLMEDFFRFVTTLFYWSVWHIQRPDLPAAFKILKTMEYYLLIILHNSVLLIGWAFYNQLRFRGKERRKSITPVGAKDLAEFYRVPTKDVVAWQKHKIMTMHHDGHGNLLRTEHKPMIRMQNAPVLQKSRPVLAKAANM